jgi:glycosyltransferase involved in cell wall biosynthesis
MTDHPIDVVHLQRKPGPGLHSIERLFEDVREELSGSDIQIRVRINDYMSRGIRPRLHDAWAARRYQGQVNHVTGDVHYLCWWLDPARTVLTVHDCVGLSRMRGLRRRVFRHLWYTRPLHRSKFITVVSDFTRRELTAETGVDPERVQVIHPHLSAEFVPVPQSGPPKLLRVLQIGTAPNKNIERLAAALAGLPVDLTVIGKLDASQRAAIQDAGIKFNERTGLGREEMPQMYADADIIAFASTYEGFGLPIIEGQAVGRPVVTSNRCSMPEAAGEAACIVDPLDVASIRAGFQRLMADPDYRNSLIQAGFRNIERFRLSRIAAQYAALYRRIADEAKIIPARASGDRV